VGDGDEVIVPSLTFCATANVVVHTGARPVLVECGDDCNIDPDAIARAITPRTKAIIPVHFAGHPADLDAITTLAGRHGIPVIEDAAHAVGAYYRGRRIGTRGHTCVFSFHANKNLTTGEGGMVTLADGELAARLRRLARHGVDQDTWTRHSVRQSWRYSVVEAGYKCSMSDIQAAIGLHQLRKVDAFNQRRCAIAACYNAAFVGLPIDLPVQHDDRIANWHLYVIRIRPDSLRIDRDGFINELKKRRIACSVHYVPVHLHPFYRDRFGYRPTDLPRTTSIYERSISLPLYPRMSDQDVEDVIAEVTAVCVEHCA
jgi:dTDP-4-amino-4,6-dideoxygalactose transaminase